MDSSTWARNDHSISLKITGSKSFRWFIMGRLVLLSLSLCPWTPPPALYVTLVSGHDLQREASEASTEGISPRTFKSNVKLDQLYREVIQNQRSSPIFTEDTYQELLELCVFFMILRNMQLAEPRVCPAVASENNNQCAFNNSNSLSELTPQSFKFVCLKWSPHYGPLEDGTWS